MIGKALFSVLGVGLSLFIPSATAEEQKENIITMEESLLELVAADATIAAGLALEAKESLSAELLSASDIERALARAITITAANRAAIALVQAADRAQAAADALSKWHH